MPDIFYKLCFFALFFGAEFGIIYLWSRKTRPDLAWKLNLGAWFLLLLLSAYSGALAAVLSFVLLIAFLFILKKPDQTLAFQQFYTANKIYASAIKPQAVLDILGDKKWICAEGILNKNINQTISYLFWQGSVSSYVTTGKYAHTTAYTYYLAFIFLPGTVSEVFKKNALAAADRSGYTFKQKLKFFFAPDTETPCLVKTAADGSFIIQYVTIPDTEHYARRLDWVKENIGKLYSPASVFSLTGN